MSEPGICANCGHSAGHHRLYRKSCSFQNACECQKFVAPPSLPDRDEAERAWIWWLDDDIKRAVPQLANVSVKAAFVAGYLAAKEDDRG